jgi:hypothetical protein
MKNKIIVSLLSLTALFFVFAVSANASTSIRLQQPQSPTNHDSFNITFVALDTDSNQVVTVQCYKKGPGDASFVPFGTLFTLSPQGGNTDNCQVGNGALNQNGTYQFEAIASGTSSPTSNIVSVDFNTSGPGNPGDYKKEKPDNCTYKISFHTADDSGKTVKVNLYRSTDLSFPVDSGHQVNTVSIGSSTDGSMTDNISPNCSTNYYYVIRAFDIYGNGSGAVGDSSTTTTVINPTGTAQGLQGAIPVTNDVLGAAAGGTSQDKEVLGTESAQPTPSSTTETTKVDQNPVSAAINWIFTHKKIDLLILLIVAAFVYFLYRKFYKKVK